MFVTSSVHSESVTGWKKVSTHLRQIWYEYDKDANESLDLMWLHQEITDFKKAKLDFDAAKTAEDILDQF